VLVEERAALLTELFFVRRMRLADRGKEVHGRHGTAMARLCARKYKNRHGTALVRQEIQEPHKLPMQAAGGRRDQGQESFSVLQVVEAVVVHLAFGGVDEHAIGVLSMPKRSVATDASSIPVAAVLLAGVQVIGVNRVSATGAMLTGVRCTKAQTKTVTKLLRESRRISTQKSRNLDKKSGESRNLDKKLESRQKCNWENGRFRVDSSPRGNDSRRFDSPWK